MELSFDSNSYIYIFAYLLLPICVVYGINIFKKGSYNDNFFSKTQTDILRGICIVLIIVTHITQRIITNELYIIPLRLSGNIGNVIFLFLSGYSIMESFTNKKDYLNKFIFKRLRRIYLPFVLVNTTMFILCNLVLNSNISFKMLIFDSLEIKGIYADNTLWYIIATLLFCLAFYFIFKCLDRKLNVGLLFAVAIIYILVCKHLKLGNWWYTSAFCFPMGVYFSANKEKAVCKIKDNYLMVFIVSLLGSGATYTSFVIPVKGYLLFNMLFTVLFIVLTIVIMLKIKLKSKILTLLGEISYEIYLIHIALLYTYFKIVNLKSGYNFYLYIILSITLAFILNRILSYKLSIQRFKKTNNNIA